MSTFSFKKGKDIRLKGAARKEIVEVLSPKLVAIQPMDFRGLKPRVIVQEGDSVKKGTPIIVDKLMENMKLTAPVSGKVKSISRGEKRVLLAVVIENDHKNAFESFKKYQESEINNLKREEIIQNLLQSGLWPVIRQRPFTKIASAQDNPKAIFIRALNTDPLAADIDFVLEGQQKEFQAGLNIIKKLTAGKTHLCIKNNTSSQALTSAKGVEIHRFSGPHPTGNVSTHIQAVDPINKGDIIWYIEAQDVIRIAQLFLSGAYPSQCIVALTGEGADNTVYAKTIVGTSIKDLLPKTNFDHKRCISGSILSGRNVGPDGFLGFYDSQITVIPEGGKRELLGWMVPGFNKYTLSHTYASAFLPEKEASLNTDKNGSDRAIVLNNVYDNYMTLDILPYFLFRAIFCGDIEEAEKLGILECDEEDFALASFACPSKIDLGSYIRSCLDLIEKEG
ncbi:MAG: Na(+)-translocating NADH-quinone reductase subunit A [Candidatus Omnitrophota bacterium]